MKPSLMFTLLVLSSLLYEVQGTRLKKSSIRASNHQELITKSSSSNQDDASAVTTKLSSSGINRKLMTKVTSSSFTTTNDKNNEKGQNTLAKFTRELVEKEKTFSTTLEPSKHGKTEVVSEQYPDVIDLTGMDYSPAKRKPPIHN